MIQERKYYTESVFESIKEPEEIEIRDDLKLTKNQLTRLNRFVKSKNYWCQIGRSNGCNTSKGNYHATYAVRENGNIVVFRIKGDPRSSIKKIKKQYDPR